jgi:predicted amidophosphoribosyltransferase
VRCAGCDLPLNPEAFGAIPEPRCGRCLAHPLPFEALRSVAPYAGVARDIVKAFKYEGADFLAPHLGARMIAACVGLPDFDAVLPIRKVRETARQAQLPLEARGENVRGAFRAARIAGSLLLVDDVATSGATLAACARELRARGARRVIAVAFGRALPEDN